MADKKKTAENVKKKKLPSIEEYWKDKEEPGIEEATWEPTGLVGMGRLRKAGKLGMKAMRALSPTGNRAKMADKLGRKLKDIKPGPTLDYSKMKAPKQPPKWKQKLLEKKGE